MMCVKLTNFNSVRKSKVGLGYIRVNKAITIMKNRIKDYGISSLYAKLIMMYRGFIKKLKNHYRLKKNLRLKALPLTITLGNLRLVDTNEYEITNYFDGNGYQSYNIHLKQSKLIIPTDDEEDLHEELMDAQLENTNYPLASDIQIEEFAKIGYPLG